MTRSSPQRATCACKDSRKHFYVGEQNVLHQKVNVSFMVDASCRNTHPSAKLELCSRLSLSDYSMSLHNFKLPDAKDPSIRCHLFGFFVYIQYNTWDWMHLCIWQMFSSNLHCIEARRSSIWATWRLRMSKAQLTRCCPLSTTSRSGQWCN